MADRVDFTISNNGISVGANVTRDYFEERVLPLISTLLVEMTPSQKRRAAAKRPKRAETRQRQDEKRQVDGAPQLPSVISTPDATRAAIMSYGQRPYLPPSRTHILA